jgi:hypothetical protein
MLFGSLILLIMALSEQEIQQKIKNLLKGMSSNTVKEILEDMLKCINENSTYNPKDVFKSE